MRWQTKCTMLTAMLGLSLAAPIFAGSAEDDLAAVKKAVLSSAQKAARPPAEDPRPETRPSRDTGEMRFFRVHIAEKGRGGARVSVKLPIGLARLAGDDRAVSSRRGCSERSHCRVTFGDLLRALDSGLSLVDIEDNEASVRVWVE